MAPNHRVSHRSKVDSEEQTLPVSSESSSPLGLARCRERDAFRADLGRPDSHWVQLDARRKLPRALVPDLEVIPAVHTIFVGHNHIGWSVGSLG